MVGVAAEAMCGDAPQSLLAMCTAEPCAESREKLSSLLAALSDPLGQRYLCPSSGASGLAMVQLSERRKWRGCHFGRSIGATGQSIPSKYKLVSVIFNTAFFLRNFSHFGNFVQTVSDGADSKCNLNILSFFMPFLHSKLVLLSRCIKT